MESIELRPAFAYDCEYCGKENFVNGIVLDLSKEESEELKEEYGIEEYEQGNWMSMPKNVICKYCKTNFLTNHYGF